MKDFIGFSLILIVAIGIGNFKINLENREKAEIANAKQEELKKEQDEKISEQVKKEIKEEAKKDREQQEKDEVEKTKSKNYGSYTYKTYKDSRFGFSFKYPSFLEVSEKGLEGEGITIKDKEERVRLVAWGENNLSGVNLKIALENDVNRLEMKCYKKIKGNHYVLSWEDEKIIYYKICMVGRGSINTLFLEYPKADRESFHKIIDNIYKSFKQGDLSLKK